MHLYKKIYLACLSSHNNNSHLKSRRLIGVVGLAPSEDARTGALDGHSCRSHVSASDCVRILSFSNVAYQYAIDGGDSTTSVETLHAQCRLSYLWPTLARIDHAPNDAFYVYIPKPCQASFEAMWRNSQLDRVHSLRESQCFYVFCCDDSSADDTIGLQTFLRNYFRAHGLLGSVIRRCTMRSTYK